MSKVNRYDLHIHQGETWSVTLTVKDSNNVAKDLTGYTAKMQFRNKANGAVYDTLETGGSGITITALSGLIEIAMTAAETAALTFTRGVYDIYIKSSGGTYTYLLKGDVYIEPRVTR